MKPAQEVRVPLTRHNPQKPNNSTCKACSREMTDRVLPRVVSRVGKGANQVHADRRPTKGDVRGTSLIESHFHVRSQHLLSSMPRALLKGFRCKTWILRGTLQFGTCGCNFAKQSVSEAYCAVAASELRCFHPCTQHAKPMQLGPPKATSDLTNMIVTSAGCHVFMLVNRIFVAVGSDEHGMTKQPTVH